VLAVKGSEPLALNFIDFLDDLGAGRVQIEINLGSPATEASACAASSTASAKFRSSRGRFPAV
jgi:hypothetical protein